MIFFSKKIKISFFPPKTHNFPYILKNQQIPKIFREKYTFRHEILTSSEQPAVQITRSDRNYLDYGRVRKIFFSNKINIFSDITPSGLSTSHFAVPTGKNRAGEGFCAGIYGTVPSRVSPRSEFLRNWEFRIFF